MQYTEEDLREAFQAGMARGAHEQARNYFDAPLDEDEYIESLLTTEKVVEKIPVTYRTLIRAVRDWEEFCDITGVGPYAKNEGYDFKDTELFYIDQKVAEKLGI